MWQRIQTLWWLIAIVAIALFVSQDFLLYRSAGQMLPDLVQSSTGVETLSGQVVYSNYIVAALAGISLIGSLICIFIYKMRTFQLRLSVLNALILVGLMLSIGYTCYRFTTLSGADFAGITLWLSLPLIAIIAQVLATRAVLKDEVLIRMSNRLR